jgi:excisionase family DNA binding protein
MATPDSDDKLLTAEEVAAMLRMTPAWIYAQTRKDALPHLRLGRYVRYRRSAITAWLATIEMGDGTLAPAERRR